MAQWRVLGACRPWKEEGGSLGPRWAGSRGMLKMAVHHTKSGRGAGTCRVTEASTLGLPAASRSPGVCHSPPYPTGTAELPTGADEGSQ